MQSLETHLSSPPRGDCIPPEPLGGKLCSTRDGGGSDQSRVHEAEGASAPRETVKQSLEVLDGRRKARVAGCSTVAPREALVLEGVLVLEGL